MLAFLAIKRFISPDCWTTREDLLFPSTSCFKVLQIIMVRQLALVSAGPTRVSYTLVALGMAAALKERGIRVLQCCCTADEGPFLGADEPRKDCLSGTPAVHINPFVMSRGDVLDCVDLVSNGKAELAVLTGCQGGQWDENGRGGNAAACAEGAKLLGAPAVLIVEVGTGSTTPHMGASPSQASLAAAAFVAASSVHEAVSRHPSLDIVGILAAEVLDPSQLSELSMALSHLGVTLPLLGGLPSFPASTIQHIRQCRGRHRPCGERLSSVGGQHMSTHDRIRQILPELSDVLEDNVDISAVLAATSSYPHSGSVKHRHGDGGRNESGRKIPRSNASGHYRGPLSHQDDSILKLNSCSSVEEGLNSLDSHMGALVNQSADITGISARSPRLHSQDRVHERLSQGLGSSSYEMDHGFRRSEAPPGWGPHNQLEGSKRRGQGGETQARSCCRQQSRGTREELFDHLPQRSSGFCSLERRLEDKPPGLLRLGVARDAAFPVLRDQMAYLRILQDLGAEVVFFSPLSCSSLPSRLNAVILRGCKRLTLEEVGQLSANRGLVHSLRSFSMEGGTILAEGAGVCLLAESMQIEGEFVGDGGVLKFPMAGLLPVSAQQKGGRLSDLQACLVRVAASCKIFGSTAGCEKLQCFRGQNPDWLEVEVLPSAMNFKDLAVGLELVGERSCRNHGPGVVSTSAGSSCPHPDSVIRGRASLDKAGPGCGKLRCSSSMSYVSTSSSSFGNVCKGSTSCSGSGSASDASGEGGTESPRSALDLLKPGSLVGMKPGMGHQVQGFFLGPSVLASLPLLDLCSNRASLHAFLDHCRSNMKSPGQDQGLESRSFKCLVSPRTVGKRHAGAIPWEREGSDSDDVLKSAEEDSDFWGWEKCGGDRTNQRPGIPGRGQGGNGHLKQNKSFAALTDRSYWCEGTTQVQHKDLLPKDSQSKCESWTKGCNCVDCLPRHESHAGSCGDMMFQEGKAFRRSWSGAYGMPLPEGCYPLDTRVIDAPAGGRSSCLGSLVSPRLYGGISEGADVIESQGSRRRASSNGGTGVEGGPRWEENPGLFADGLFLERGWLMSSEKTKKDNGDVCLCNACEPVRERLWSLSFGAKHPSTTSLQSLENDRCGMMPPGLTSPCLGSNTFPPVDHYSPVTEECSHPTNSWSAATRAHALETISLESTMRRRGSTGALSSADGVQDEGEGPQADPWLRGISHKGSGRGRREGRRSSWASHGAGREKEREGGEDLQAVPEEDGCLMEVEGCGKAGRGRRNREGRHSQASRRHQCPPNKDEQRTPPRHKRFLARGMQPNLLACGLHGLRGLMRNGGTLVPLSPALTRVVSAIGLSGRMKALDRHQLDVLTAAVMHSSLPNSSLGAMNSMHFPVRGNGLVGKCQAMAPVALLVSTSAGLSAAESLDRGTEGAGSSSDLNSEKEEGRPGQHIARCPGGGEKVMKREKGPPRWLAKLAEAVVRRMQSLGNRKDAAGVSPPSSPGPGVEIRNTASEESASVGSLNCMSGAILSQAKHGKASGGSALILSRPQTLADVVESLGCIGSVLGTDKAEHLQVTVRQRLRKVARAVTMVPEGKKPRVSIVTFLDLAPKEKGSVSPSRGGGRASRDKQLTCALAGQLWLQEVVSFCGGMPLPLEQESGSSCAVGSTPCGGSSHWSCWRDLLSALPDIVLVLVDPSSVRSSAGELSKFPGFCQLQAVEHSQVFFCSSSLFSPVALSLVEGIDLLTYLLHYTSSMPALTGEPTYKLTWLGGLHDRGILEEVC